MKLIFILFHRIKRMEKGGFFHPVWFLLTTILLQASHEDADISFVNDGSTHFTSRAIDRNEKVAGAKEFKFTRAFYNISIPENSPGKTVLSSNERMGIEFPVIDHNLGVQYNIIDGDKDNFFKAEERVVGNFCFLLLRTRTGNVDVLNRERKDKYVIKVRAKGTRQDGENKLSVLEADSTIVVTVLDTNDLKPLFYPTEYEQTVPEDMPLHKFILRVSAEDADLGLNGEIYYSFLESTDQFSVHPITGFVSLTRPLNYNERSIHEMTVIAQDRGIPIPSRATKPSTARLKIRVKQMNLYSPEIYIHQPTEISEQSNINIYAIVRVTDKDKGISGKIQSLDIIDGDKDGHFRIKSSDESSFIFFEYNVEIIQSLDREMAPKGYNLTLRATDQGNPPRKSYKSFTVRLVDLNDNSPVFDREIYEAEIPEIAPINTPIIRLNVTDIDEGNNAQLLIKIVGGNEGGEFYINSNTGMIYTAVKLDVEFQSFYTLTISATDQASTGTRKYTSATVKINVIDTNDNDPIFDMVEEKVWVNENEPAGTFVTKVTAKDKDYLDNAYISYSIANLSPVPFDIDHFSGEVRTTSVLDFETMKREYFIKIRASDWGIPYRRQAEVQIRIVVRDINDNRPQFENIDCVGRVPQHIPVGTEILTLSAVDFDAGTRISYQVLSGNMDECFSLDRISGVLSVACSLMDSQILHRDFNITATDGTHSSDILHVMVHISTTNDNRFYNNLMAGNMGSFDCHDTGVARRFSDILVSAEKNNLLGQAEDFAMTPSRYGENIHSPEFIDVPLETHVSESVPLGTILLRIQADDRDLGYNGMLVFGISSGDQDSVFSLDINTGDLKVVGYLDREREQEYILNITVYDLGRPQKSSSVLLPITVLDVNDNAPSFEKSISSLHIVENTSNGTQICVMRVTDKDLGENAYATYSMVTTNSEFSIDPDTGVVYVSSDLDRERQELYELIIRATDGGKNFNIVTSLSADAFIRITIDDVNDNAPLFVITKYSVKVREDIPVRSVVAIISASDSDKNLGGEVHYSLVSSDDTKNVFSIDALSGTIRTAQYLNYEERQSYRLKVRAQDHGEPSLSSEATVLVEIVDVNENIHAPLFNDSVMETSVKENLPVGTLVSSVRAVDEDSPSDDSLVGYSIHGGDGMGMFSIDNKGNIRTLTVLDAESKQYYWLTVVAQDHGVVPLKSSLEVFVGVENINDNTPLTEEPVYYISVLENTSSGKVVLHVRAEDRDFDPGQELSYLITAGNDDKFFSLDRHTGVMKTTGRKLDRENQSEHILEVTVCDNGEPALTSTTTVVVTVEDVNDHAPQFEQSFYKVNIPDSANHDTPLFQVLAYDEDIGPNGDLQYSILSGRGMGKFKIHPKTGLVYAQRSFQAGQEYDLRIQVEDDGAQKKNQATRVSIQVLRVPKNSPHPPTFKAPNQVVEVTESDSVGFLVALIQAGDEDEDRLWYNIVGGDDQDEFFIGRDKGDILLAKQLDWERKNNYNLTISVTDGSHTSHTQLLVNVIDMNDHRPEFSDRFYHADVSEDLEEGTTILRLLATDKDEGERLYYSWHAARESISLDLFELDSVSGAIYLQEKLDRETIEEHVLTVMVKDQGTPSKRNYARVTITVHDHNDHSPEFTSPIIQGKVYETSSVGAVVVQVCAIDRDRGENARITYSIISGNVGNAFKVDPSLGSVSVSKDLDMSVLSEYMLIVRATDAGSPFLSSTIPVHILVTMADNAPPRFSKQVYTVEVYENQPIGAYVSLLETRSSSSLFYEIMEGDSNEMFLINPSTGVITTQQQLDYESRHWYNLTIEASNMAGAKSRCWVSVHVLDRNDNAPRFLQVSYSGSVPESAAIGSLVLTNSSPIALKARDADSGLNSLLSYDIVESLPRRFFKIDPITGVIRTTLGLDYETTPEFHFSVKVFDSGHPQLSSDTVARVRISVMDVNDNPPLFVTPHYNATLFLPTYGGVTVLLVNALDPDTLTNTRLRYDIIDGNKGDVFAVDETTGKITVSNPKHVKHYHTLHLRVSDGKFSGVARVYIKVERSGSSYLRFHKELYEGTVLENSTKISNVLVVDVLGGGLNEHVLFSIISPTDMFEIGSTSGAIRSSGKKFDREEKEHFEIVVKAETNGYLDGMRHVAHAIVNITVLDMNDNCPMFVDMPYRSIISINALKGDVVIKVHAIDLDKGENGEVRYELTKSHGELFKVCRKTGEIQLKQNLEGLNRGLDVPYELTITAYDGGIIPCTSKASVQLKIVDELTPSFNKQLYTVSVVENIELYSPLDIDIRAESLFGHTLVYTIVAGDDLEEFSLDFTLAPTGNNGPCVIYVVDQLDRERQDHYDLTLRATDTLTKASSDVTVTVFVQDVNDCPPEFGENVFNVSVLEDALLETLLLRVQATDRDTGMNQLVRYEIHKDSSNSSEYFHIDPEDGCIYLKRYLDHELSESHHFTVVAADEGLSSLFTTAHVWVKVLDTNDNPPKFEQSSYVCFLSEDATRGQFVTMVAASDPDYVDLDNLVYAIMGGNRLQIFSIDPATGVITLRNLQNFADPREHTLNVSVTDGVYTSFASVKIELLPANRHNPSFPQVQVEAKVMENLPHGTFVTKVTATDEDFGIYGEITYSIPSEWIRETFRIDKKTGEIFTMKKINRETDKLYEIPVASLDGGGRRGFTMVRVKVLDENDNAPRFLLREYKATIPSNFSTNFTLIKVKAVDDDENISAEVEYSIYETQYSEAKDIFGINRHTGSIHLLKSAVRWVNQVFQFFIRAQDYGTPRLHSYVPIEINVMDPQEVVPIFERRDGNFLISENSSQGTLITRLKTVTNTSVRYLLVSGSEQTPQFAVDSRGRLTLLRSLDRELQDSHLIAVLAETDSAPPLTALTQVTLKVLDENDNAPEFESSPYKMTLAENVAEGTSILRVFARDMDEGVNGEVRYSFSPEMGGLSDTFALDAYTGWITTLTQLDKEKQSELVFQVVATDNGHQRHFARTSVYITLQDYNDNPPVFTNRHYVAAVNEDALPGTMVIQIKITDADMDLRSPIEFYITRGDPRSQFKIGHDSRVYVAKPLDREKESIYVLDVTATDGKFIATTAVTIEILDVNDNPPLCLKPRYHQLLSEGVNPGSYVLTILASDNDEETNTNLHFYLTGEGSDHFIIDKTEGHLKTARSLDREEQSKYQLVAHVEDRDKSVWECSSQVEIIVSDLNDNSPQFTMDTYSATLAEDVMVGTMVAKIHATDKDTGVNRRIKYSLAYSDGGHFNITTDSGIVTLVKPLDRDTRAMYNLSVQALDRGVPQLSELAALTVTVLGYNDNPPEFTSKYYHATVPESASVGSEVARVLATGGSAGVIYSIIGGNVQDKFKIHPKTGVISTVSQLDYERAKIYYLTIQAVDGGFPPLSNHASVNITVTDSNDNPPVFNLTYYTAYIREDAPIGAKVLQVFAHDVDQESNGMVLYSLKHRWQNKKFSIDKKTGHITVAGSLDRESVSSYVMEVQARDGGIPVLSKSVVVKIELSDANDNPPVFSKPNYTVVFQEDKPLGFTVLKFVVSDDDIAPNTGPYTFDILSGNDRGSFLLEHDGTLKTAVKLNSIKKDRYFLRVRVYDNGALSLFSDTVVDIKVVEESQYPPIITPMEIIVNSFMDRIPGGLLGKIHASDQDQYDILTYKLVSTVAGGISENNANNLFDLDRNNGTLLALPRLDVGEYWINVSVTDGKFTTHSIVKVSVLLVTEEMLRNSITVRFEDVDPLVFMINHSKGFVRVVRNTLRVRVKDVIIISLEVSGNEQHMKHDPTRSGGNVHVLFAVRKQQTKLDSTSYYSSDTVYRAIMDHLEELQSVTGLVAGEIVYDKCITNYCVYGECRNYTTLDISDVRPIANELVSFVSPRYSRKAKCQCKEGYAGDLCEVVIDACAGDPCPSKKTCLPDATVGGYTCACPEGLVGSACETDVTSCLDRMCYIPRNPVSFSGKSYTQYSINKTVLRKTMEERLLLSFRMRTVHLTGNLMYAAGRMDYNILEIVNGVLQYRFELGSGEGVARVSDVLVSDGSWHEVLLEREGNSARVTVDGRHVAHGSAPGVSDMLNLQSDCLYLGSEVRPHPTILGFEDVQQGFTGCMDDVRISGVSVPLHMSGSGSIAVLKRFANVEFGCDTGTVLMAPGVCGSQPCLNGGTCKDLGGDSFRCECHTRFTGPTCSLDTDPCASSPCLHGGFCRQGPTLGGYACECSSDLSGKRCEFGRYCNSDPCRNGGTCEEGDSGPACRCAGYAGELCEVDVNECEMGGCFNGATCVNEPGGFQCICPPNATGPHCGEPLYSTQISSSIYNVTWEEVVGILVSVTIICLVVTLFIIYRRFHVNTSRNKRNQATNEVIKGVVMNSFSIRPNESDFKRGTKHTNMEGTQVFPHYLPRSPSYISSSESTPYSSNALNNVDTVRSLSSAESEDYPQSPSLPTRADNSHKTDWPDLMEHKQMSIYSTNMNNDLQPGIVPELLSCVMTSELAGQRSQVGDDVHRDNNDPHTIESNHWDYKDWVSRSRSRLPNIAELSDSPSSHSNQSITNINCRGNAAITPGPIETGQVIEVVSRAQDKTYFSESKQPNCPCHTISGNEYHSYTPERINDDHESESRSQSLNTGKKDSPPHGSTNQSAQNDGKSSLTEVGSNIPLIISVPNINDSPSNINDNISSYKTLTFKKL